jgi:hypothetical protein
VKNERQKWKTKNKKQKQKVRAKQELEMKKKMIVDWARSKKWKIKTRNESWIRTKSEKWET